jgi:hypothetical protein
MVGKLTPTEVDTDESGSYQGALFKRAETAQEWIRLQALDVGFHNTNVC